MTATITETRPDEETRVVTEVDTISDHDINTSDDQPDSAHYVMSPNPDETNHAYVMRARVEGFAVEAICGYTWIPNQSATGLPVCSKCRDLWRSLPDDGGGDPRE